MSKLPVLELEPGVGKGMGVRLFNLSGHRERSHSPEEGNRVLVEEAPKRPAHHYRRRKPHNALKNVVLKGAAGGIIRRVR